MWSMSNPELPSDVNEFLDFVGMEIKSSGVFAWEERNRIKADMMRVRHRWSPARVSDDALHAKCQAVGMTAKDIDDVMGWLHATQSGGQLRPRYFKDFRWHQDPTE